MKKLKPPTLKQRNKQLLSDREFDAQRISLLHNENQKLKDEKATWGAQRNLRELDLKSQVIQSAAHLIEGLCKMIGGPGF